MNFFHCWIVTFLQFTFVVTQIGSSIILFYCRVGLRCNGLEIQLFLEGSCLLDLSLGFFLMFILQLLMKLEKFI